MNKNDRHIDLATRIAKGDYEAEELLFTEFGPRIHLIVSYRAYYAAMVDDIAGYCTGLVLEKLREGKYDPAKGPVAGYIYGICRNEIKRCLKVEIKHAYHFGFDEMHTPGHSTSSKFDLPIDLEYLTELVHSLKPRLQQVLVLRYFMDYTVQEIMYEMELSTPQKVYDLLSEAKKQIRRMVSPDAIYYS